MRGEPLVGVAHTAAGQTSERGECKLWQICRAAFEFLLEIKYNRLILANKKIKHEGEKK